MSESEVFTPFSGNSPRKREFFFGKTENAKRILFWLIRVPFFEGEFPGKGIKTSLSNKKYLAEIPCITVEFVSDLLSTYIKLSSMFFAGFILFSLMLLTLSVFKYRFSSDQLSRSKYLILSIESARLVEDLYKLKLIFKIARTCSACRFLKGTF